MLFHARKRPSEIHLWSVGDAVSCPAGASHRRKPAPKTHRCAVFSFKMPLLSRDNSAEFILQRWLILPYRLVHQAAAPHAPTEPISSFLQLYPTHCSSKSAQMICSQSSRSSCSAYSSNYFRGKRIENIFDVQRLSTHTADLFRPTQWDAE